MLARLFPAAVVDPPHRAGTGDAWVYRAFDRSGSKTLVIPDAIRADAMPERLIEVTEPRIRSILGQPGQRWAECVNGADGILVEERSRRAGDPAGCQPELKSKANREPPPVRTRPPVRDTFAPLTRGAQQGRWDVGD
jgi:hypothetical protein